MTTHTEGTRLDRLNRRVSEPIARRLAGIRGVTPNRVTISAFAAGGLMTPVLVLSGHLRLAGVAYIVGDLLDYVDGDVARAQGTTSVQGDVLDGILDRYTDFLAVSAMMIAASGVPHLIGPLAAVGVGRPGTGVAIVVGLLALLGSMMPSYIQAISVASGGTGTVQSIGGRGTRNRLVYVGLLLRQPFWTLVAIAALSNLAAIHRAYDSLSTLGRND